MSKYIETLHIIVAILMVMALCVTIWQRIIQDNPPDQEQAYYNGYVDGRASCFPTQE